MEFYERVLSRLLEDGSISQTDSILVVCGGLNDAQALKNQGFSNAIISNLSANWKEVSEPYPWALENAEHLSFPDKAFDWCFVHAGLHHCFSPHRGLLEMYRVARKGVLVIEARDSLLMRLAVQLGFTVDYELEGFVNADFVAGETESTGVPNYVYRWTEREVVKTIESAQPHRKNSFRYFYSLRFPIERMAMSSLLKRIMARGLWAAAQVFHRLFPKQCNSFAFVVLDTGQFKPWITADGRGIRRDYSFKFDPAKPH
jgi:ubiquinone/menaquinone biosynthesis C-methylase UbiE